MNNKNNILAVENTECCGFDASALKEIDELAHLAKALGHAYRVAIVKFLEANAVCMCGQIVDNLPLAQSTVSQHLKKLKEAGWIKGEIEGPKTCYCIDPETVKRFKELVDKL